MTDRRQKKIIWIVAFGFLALGVALCPLIGQAEIYQFVDRDGTVHFTNVPTDHHYRSILITRPPVLSYRQLHNAIHKTGQQYHVDPRLIRAVIKVESDFDPWAVSSAGAQGLMQLMPETASALSVINPFDPEENIDGGTRHLRYLLNLFQGNTRLAVAAYHAGEKMIQQYGGIPPIRQTQEYVERVMKTYRNYKGIETAHEKIYQVVTSDGQVIYTNRPIAYRDSQARSPNLPVRQTNGSVSLVQYSP